LPREFVGSPTSNGNGGLIRKETMTKVIDRPHLQELLGQLKNLDPEGWCAMTDGSFDEEDDLSVEVTIKDAIKYIYKQ
jgi:hypothetical protein